MSSGTRAQANTPTTPHLGAPSPDPSEPIPPSAAAGQFLELLSEACQAVGEEWFLLPVDNDRPAQAYRERVYCYELYHQLRRLSEDGSAAGAPAYTVSGEIDKAGLHAVIENGGHKPDLLWHVPGRRLNAVIVEVKMTKRWDKEGIAKDLRTFTEFLTAPHGRAYERAVLLLYGPGDPTELLGRVRDEAEPAARDALSRAHVFLHPRWGQPAQDLGPLYKQSSW